MKFISLKEGFPRLFNILPGWLQGVIHCVTAGTGVGKTKMVKSLFLLYSYQYCKRHNIPFYCIWFALEESSDVFWTTILSDLLEEKYGFTLTYYQLKGYHEGKTEQHDRAIEALQPKLDEMKRHIFVVDYVSNPTGIYKTIQKFMTKLGKRTDGITDQDEFGNKWTSFDFVYNNPDTQVMLVVDHMTLVTPEKNEFGDASTKHAAITKLSEYLIKFIARKYRMIPVIIHQQEATTGNVEDIKHNRLEPSLDKLGVNKIVQQEYEVVLGIFNPVGVNPPLSTYKGYDMEKFNGHFRSVNILKHRKGEGNNMSFPFYFKGKTNEYRELPPAKVQVDGRWVDNPQLNEFYNLNQ